MSVDLRAAAADHLANRRARGYHLADHGWLLSSFLDGLDAHGHTTITVADAVAFAQAQPATGRLWQATRLRAVRGLAAHVHAVDPAAAELIPAGLIPAKVTRRVPYLYSDEQIATLMSGAAALSPALLAASMHTLIGLLAVTGLRSGEAVALNVEDLDADRRVLAVTGKYGKRRIVPLHHTTLQALADYRQARATGAAPTGALLVGAKGGRLRADKARAAFRALADACDLPARPGCGPPRLHDLRHTFAVNSQRDRRHHHRAVARPRLSRVEPPLPARRPAAQTTRPRPHGPTTHPPGSLPRTRQTTHLPRRTSNYAELPGQITAPTSRFSANIDITGTSA